MLPPPTPPAPKVAGKKGKPCGCKPKKGKRKRQQVGEVWTAPMVRDYIRRTSSAFDAVDADWKKAEQAGKAEPTELSRWRSLLRDWRKFVADVEDTWADMASVLAPFDARTATVQRIDEYRKQLDVWTRRVRKLLGPEASSAPTLTPSNAGARAWWSKFGQDLAIGLAVAGATALVVTLVSGSKGR